MEPSFHYGGIITFIFFIGAIPNNTEAIALFIRSYYASMGALIRDLPFKNSERFEHVTAFNKL